MTRNTDILSHENTLWTQGISAIMVMLMHFIMQIEGYPRIVNILGSIGVAAFLFISGFGLNESYKKSGLAGYWHKRIVRVIIPCWLVFLFKLPFEEQFSLSRLVHNLLFTDSELWFVDYIVRWYIIYWLARRLSPRHTTKILAVFSVAFIFAQQLMCEQAFSFFCGYIVSQHYDKVRQTSRGRIIKFTAAAFAYGTAFMLIKEIPFVRGYIGTVPFNVILLNIKLPLAVAIITAPYILPQLKRLRPISWFGKISYEIYIVHFFVLPFVTDFLSIIKYMAASTVIAAVFNRINNELKNNFTTVFTSILYIAVCYIMACKYSMRATEHFGYVSMSYAVILALVTLLFNRRKTIISRHSEAIFWSMAVIMAVAMAAVQYHFDPMQNQVDRWSAIANPLTAMFSGQFPYSAQTHLGGYASPFPVWMVFHIPFWALGNVGLSEIFTALLFVISVKAAYGSQAGIKATVLLALSINLWYETAVRSDLISNFLLLASFINLLICKKITFSKYPFMLAAISGLWLSTRISTAFPLFIMFFPFWLRLSAGHKVSTLLIAAAVLCLTFLPFALWDWHELFYAENNPFSLQSRQGRPADSLLLLAAAVIMALKWKGNNKMLMLFSAIMLILVPVLAYGHNMYVYGNWTDIFNSAYDITYLDASLPFCITLMAAFGACQMQAKKPSL